MIGKIADIKFKKIKRISPSQFYSMRNCPYKSLLAEAFEKKPLLPVSPNAYYGTVLHRMLELISKRELPDEETFNKRFDNEIANIEEELKSQGYSFFVPLQINVKDYGIKKILLKKHFKNSIAKTTIIDAVKYFSEKWFESKDQLIGGKIDLIIESENGIEIIDFKTGAVQQDYLDDSGDVYSDIKNEYKEQLKLYAYLFFDCTGKFPTHLALVDLAQLRFNVEFSQSECKKIFDEAKGLLERTNSSIDSAIFDANPSLSNCKYCLYRPACSHYLQFLKTENQLNDVSGEIENVMKYQNGNTTLYIEANGNKYKIAGFSFDLFDFFNVNRGRQINVFNLKKESTPLVYSTTKTTIIYA